MFALLSNPGLLVAQTATEGPVKLAFFNIQSGKGEVGLSGRPVFFADTHNCTDPTLPVNGWGVGFVQKALVGALRDDASIVAVGLAEAWICGSSENVRKLLGWAARSTTRNGLSVVARYGFAGPEVWQQLDTSLNPNPADTMWVLRVPVCVDAACSTSLLTYAAHWYGTGTYKRAMYDKQAQQTVDFMRQTAGTEPHVLIGDLNAWEGTTRQCGQNPINAGIPKLRAAGYVDAWPATHGTAEGFTGMTNRASCGNPVGYTWKRIDYAWSSPGLEPLDMTRFAMPEVPGDAAPSDHYGIIATYLRPGAEAHRDTTPPEVRLTAPAVGAVVSGTMTINALATDNVGVTRVEVLEDGVVRHTLTAAPYDVACDTAGHANGDHTLQARAYDAAGNVTLSTPYAIEVRNLVAALPPVSGNEGDIVLYARRATTIAGGWQVAEEATAAGGAALRHPNANAPKLAAALAEPVHYFELTFHPVAGKAYRLWMRARAERNYWGNDSVFVQFSGSVTSTGAPTFRIGTTASTIVNLEDASHAGVSGWGWQDNGWGTNVLGSLLYFDGSPQTIRVQTREDGLSIDQIVLSPDAYLTTAPGTLMGDVLILPETTSALPASLAEVVVHASAPATIAGGWRAVTDATAADGVALTHPDAGAAKLKTALAAPVHYVELTFEVEAGRPYRLWMRGRADRNHWANDSVFVQFSGSVDASSTPIYRIGTTQSTAINLEEASNARISGWGWQDNGYGAGVLGPLVMFEATGTQTIRIQTREDGFRFDQLVLSSAQYLTAAPGTPKDDMTILDRID
ncbi:MAG: Ig-like domain-containing protein [Tepidisphaeraceae bacterium]